MKHKQKIFKGSILILAIGFLALFLKNIDFNQVSEQIRPIGFKFFQLIFVTGIGYFLGAWAWYLSFNKISLPFALPKLFVFRLIGETLATINPTSVLAGDASKVYFLKNVGVSAKEASSATIISRVLLIVSLIFILLCSSFFFFDSTLFMNSIGLKYIILTLLAVFSIGLLYFIINKNLYLSKFTRFLSSKVYTLKEERLINIQEVNLMMSDYFYNHRFKFISAFILSVLHWLSGALEFYVILSLLNVPISLMEAVIMELGVMVVKSIGAFVPGQIGVEEQGNKMMLAMIGVSLSGLWVSVSILRRSRQLFWIVLGVICYLVVSKGGTSLSNPTKAFKN